MKLMSVESGNQIPNRLARWSGQECKWKNMGPVTHVEAAEAYSAFWDRGGSVETMEEGGRVVFHHRVQKVVQFHVTPLRGDRDA